MYSIGFGREYTAEISSNIPKISQVEERVRFRKNHPSTFIGKILECYPALPTAQFHTLIVGLDP